MRLQPAAAVEEVQSLADGVADHPALDNAFFRHWMSGPLPYPQVEVFAREFHARTVDAMLMAALAVLHADDLDDRVERVKHLYTEYGSGDAAKAHLLLQEHMLTDLLGRLRGAPYTREELRAADPLPGTRAFTQGRRALFTDDDRRVVQGALLAQELLAHPSPVRLYEGLRHYRDLYDVDGFHRMSEYFYVHICEAAKIDPVRAVRSAAAVCRDGADLARLREGFDGLLDLTAGYWDTVYRAMLAA
ncbi:iron-containing redox enzyme family protein [Actinomadura kijaniata]|uniref:iron-containing redox enzyme family protein n=1 Tax=Actinomadura kijaniata TaxID=46161 RepID=UPI000829B74D|nr:iron-containing redox enzyme family protein [Actinomadura kijaniata]